MTLNLQTAITILLLEDLSHTQLFEQKDKPTLDHVLCVAKELARLHSFHWGTQANVIAADRDSVMQIARFTGHIRTGLAPLLQTVGSDIPDRWIEILVNLFDRHPQRLMQRAQNPIG